MSLLEHPTALALLADAEVSAEDVRGCCRRLEHFLRRYLPRAWAEDAERRRAAHVPQEVAFRESWRIGLDLLDRAAAGLPFGWVAGDDEFGRAAAFRGELRRRRWRYVLDVPCNTSVRD